MDNFVLWLGLGIAFLLGAIIYFSMKTSKKRAQEVTELNQYFPEKTNQEPLSGRKRFNKEKIISKREDQADVAEGEQEMGETSCKGVSSEENGQDDILEESGKPVRYRRSIFHPEHLKQEQDETKNE